MDSTPALAIYMYLSWKLLSSSNAKQQLSGCRENMFPNSCLTAFSLGLPRNNVVRLHNHHYTTGILLLWRKISMRQIFKMVMYFVLLWWLVVAIVFDCGFPWLPWNKLLEISQHFYIFPFNFGHMSIPQWNTEKYIFQAFFLELIMKIPVSQYGGLIPARGLCEKPKFCLRMVRWLFSWYSGFLSTFQFISVRYEWNKFKRAVIPYSNKEHHESIF